MISPTCQPIPAEKRRTGIIRMPPSVPPITVAYAFPLRLCHSKCQSTPFLSMLLETHVESATAAAAGRCNPGADPLSLRLWRVRIPRNDNGSGRPVRRRANHGDALMPRIEPSTPVVLVNGAIRDNGGPDPREEPCYRFPTPWIKQLSAGIWPVNWSVLQVQLFPDKAVLSPQTYINGRSALSRLAR